MQFLTVHAIVHAAMVELHNARASVDINAANRCVRSAQEIVRLLDHVDSHNADLLDPIVGVSTTHPNPNDPRDCVSPLD